VFRPRVSLDKWDMLWGSHAEWHDVSGVVQYVVVCCSELQCVVCVAVCCSALQCGAFESDVRYEGCAVYCSVLQCVAVCCRVS